jgi:translocation and assembly module TamA
MPGAWTTLVVALMAATGGAPLAAAESAKASFKVDVASDNRRVARYLERYLAIQRFADFPDLQPGELRRLLGEAESNARELLATLGYFNPVLTLNADVPAAKPGEQRRIAITVDPGPATRVERHDIHFAEPMASDPSGESQRRKIASEWLLKDGATFTQEQWSNAKTAGLRVLQRERYPTAHIADSQAKIDADADQAALTVSYDAGLPYRFGKLALEGVQRYDEQGIRNIARLPIGDIYREETLLDIQQQLVASGYFDSAFLMLDSHEQDPDHARVTAQLHEAKLQKIAFGLGFSTDTGVRVSVSHSHNKMWPLGWRAVNQVAVGTQTQLLSTNWTAMPDASGWSWNTGLALERSDVGDIKANSLSLTGGRARLDARSERRYFLRYDASKTEGGNSPPSSSSLMADYAWTGRAFDNRLSPTSGHGLGLEGGVGMTVTPNRDPFVRINARALQFLPVGAANSAGKRSRFALRVETGAILAGEHVNIPARLLFLTGGDTTVRGYGYQSIGSRLADGSTYGARYMAMGSVEWQHPFTLFGDSRSFEHTIFIDAGTATDKLNHAVLFPGVGVGLRWASPVGPLQLDLAYGTRTQNWHVHLRVGFNFQ